MRQDNTNSGRYRVMNTGELEAVARSLVAPGKGILAADESAPTIEKRFKGIEVPSTEENRRAYRDLLFTTPGMSEFISGVILYDETIRQGSADGTPFTKVLERQGIVPGVKGGGGTKGVTLPKPNMVVAGKLCPVQAGVPQVAEATVRTLRRCVPPAVPGIVFLSGGQTPRQATEHLNAMNSLGKQPWELSFSYGRALQDPVLKAWKGKAASVPAAKEAFLHRSKLNGAARYGKYSPAMEEAV